MDYELELERELETEEPQQRPPEDIIEEEVYQEWLDVIRRFRADPTLFDDVVNREDPLGRSFDANQEDGIIYVEYGIHPFYDYGFETKRGRGRVLWDLLRPRLSTARDSSKRSGSEASTT